MGKLKVLACIFLALIFTLCACSQEPDASTDATLVMSFSPSVPPTESGPPIQTDWNVEIVFKEVQYLEDDGVNGKGIMIVTETFDYNNIGFYTHLHGCALEYFNGSEWEYIFEYRGQESMTCRAIPKDNYGYASLPEKTILRRLWDRLPNGRYRYTKLLWDGSSPVNTKYVSTEFELQKPE